MKYVRSAVMTTVLAVFGLGVAAQNLHSHDRDVQAQPIAVSAPVTPVAWVDPPARAAVETTGALAETLPKPPTLAANPPAATAAPAEPLAKRAAIRRGKAWERSRARIARLRRASHARTAAADPATIPQSQARPAADKAERIDPIGDILRGLGLGRDS